MTTATTSADDSTREVFSIKWADVRMPLYFLLSMTLFGLSFYPAIALVIIILLNRWKHDRYDFVFMLTLFLGNYGMISKSQTGIDTPDIALVGSVLLWLFYRRPPLLNRIFFLLVIYTALLFFIASRSIESMSIQFLGMRNYLAIFYIIVPVVAFSDEDFDIKEFFRKAIIFCLILSAFYIIDGFILCGNVLVPNTVTMRGEPSKFYRLLWEPFSMHFYRKYPPGIYLFMLALYPVAHIYKLRWWQWLLIIGAMISTFTFTVISAYVIVYICLIVKPAKIVKYAFIFILSCVALYYIDGFLPVVKKEYYDESTLRIKSSVDQFIELRKAVDDEDIAKFASGRMSQVLPKFELVAHERRQAFGLGFLHREKTKINRYIITNEYYTDVSQNEEVATGIEITAAQIYVNTGYVGLAVHILFFLVLYLMIHRLRYARYVLSVIFANVIMGFGGFGSLIAPSGLFLVSMAVAAVILASQHEVWGRALLPHRHASFPLR